MSLEVISGCMFSGKTEELVRRLRRAEIAKVPIYAFKPAMDTRYQGAAISTHFGGTFTAIPVKTAREVESHLMVPLEVGTVIGFDEAQFMANGIIPLMEDLANRGARVVVAGLDLDYQGVPFGPMPHLLALADEVTKLNAICVRETPTGRCGKRATRSYRVPEMSTGAVVQVGGEDVYEARCRRHWRSHP